MSETIFAKIIAGAVPCHKVYEDDKTLAFLDVHPTQPGHTLVITKTETEFVWDLAPEDYSALMATAQKVARRLRDVLRVPYVGAKVVGVDVPHAHIHLIPFATADQFNHDPVPRDPDHEALVAMAKKLAF